MGLRGLHSNRSIGAVRGEVRDFKRKRARWYDVVEFIESLKVTTGPMVGKPFKLRPWQKKIVQAWYATDSKRRRLVRTGLFSVGRKNGKSALCAALALCHLVGPETEKRGQIVVGATDRDQSGLIFDEMVAFIQDSPDFARICNIKRHEKVIENLNNGSKFRALSSDAKKAHGLNPSVVILDELAQWGQGVGRALYDALTTSQGARKEPLLLIIGTQSADDHALMSNLVDYAKAVNAGDIEDPAFSGFVYEIPEGEDVWDESKWSMANPALDDFRSLEDMRLLAERAKRMPTLEATFRNLFCNQRVEAEERWLPAAEWKACLRDDIDINDLVGEMCVGGLDLSSVRDLTAFALYWPKSGVLNVWTWCPADNLRTREEKDRVPYTVWAKDGFIIPTPGGATHKGIVARQVADIYAKYKPQCIAFDRWGITEITQILDDLGIKLPFEPFGQGYQSMSPATKAFEERVINKILVTPPNPALTWAISNVAITRDASDNKKPNKDRSRERIDPAVAAIMAVGQSAILEKKTSVYTTRELLVV